MIFLPGKDCALVLVIDTAPRLKDLVVFLGGGEKKKTVREYIEKLEPELNRLAKFLCCDRIKHLTRPGGEKIGEKLGYKKIHSVMVKDVG